MCGHSAYDWNTMPMRRRSGGTCRSVLDTTVLADQDPSRIRLVEARDLPQQRRLAAARRAEDRDELAVLDVERHVVERAERAERLA